MPFWPKRISILARTASTTLAREATLYRKLHTEHRWSACPGRILLVEQQVLSMVPPFATQLQRRPRVAPEHKVHLLRRLVRR